MRFGDDVIQKLTRLSFFFVLLSSFVGVSLAAPLAPGEHLQKAVDALEPGGTLVLQDGLYHLPAPLRLGPAKDPKKPVRLVAAPNAKPVLSGAVVLGPWKSAGKDLWTCTLPEGAPFFRQLFDLDSQKTLPRSRIPNEGWLRGLNGSFVKDQITRDVARPLCDKWRRERMDIHTTLRFKEEDAKHFADWGDDVTNGEMLMLASWDTSWHSMRSVDLETRDMRFFTPSRYPMNHWHYSRNKLGAPYRLENLRAGLDQPGEWCLDRNTMTVTLMGDDPNKRRIAAPQLTHILEIEGNADQPAGAVTFEGITFSHHIYRMGVYDKHKPDWPSLNQNPKDFPPGYSDSQAVPKAGAAVRLKHARDVRFVRCNFIDVGAWGAHLEADCHDNAFERCHFSGLGAGSVNIDGGAGLQEGRFPSNNKVTDCLIEHGGTVHYATVALRIANSHENLVAHNEIRHFPYSGISVGWNWSRTPNRCFGNRIESNHIHHVTHTISDGSGIYTLGMLGGTVIRGNYIHDVLRAETSVGAGNCGALFDQYSLGLYIEGNVMRRIQSYLPQWKRHNETIRHFRNNKAEHVYGDNDLETDDRPVRLTETVRLAGPRPVKAP